MHRCNSPFISHPLAWHRGARFNTSVTLPCSLFAPTQQTSPVVLTSAHSGRVYPPDFLAAARLDPIELRRSEDSFVDELFAGAPRLGIPLLVANFPRAFCDVNREAWELDPLMFTDTLPAWVNSGSQRVQSGLGMMARVVTSGAPIYRAKLPFSEAERRVREFWQPWHTTLERLLAETRRRFGACLLIDCHSMPRADLGPGTADIVLGDAHGRSCTPAVCRGVESSVERSGYSVRRNVPYAGGYITRHYGAPQRGMHALQIEIARDLYMDEHNLSKSKGFDTLQQSIDRLLVSISTQAAVWLRS